VKIYLLPHAEIFTKTGILRMNRINSNSIVLNAKGEEVNVISNSSVDKRKFYSLLLKNGAQIVLGEDTYVMTIHGPKKIQEIKEEDFILHRFSKIVPIQSPLIEWDRTPLPHSVPIKIPLEMSPNLALWLGIVASKGRYNEENGAVTVSLNENAIGKIFRELSFKVFRTIPKNYADQKTGYKQHYIHSKGLVRFLKSTLGSNSNLKKVPQQIMEGSIETQMAFLKGLSLDGYVDNGHLVVYGGASKRLAEFTAIVLRNMGYTIYQQIRKSGGGNDIFYVKIVASCDWAEPFIPLEMEKTDNYQESGYLVKVSEEVLKAKIPTSHPNYSAIRNIRQRKSETCLNHTLDDLGFTYPKDEYYSMVKEISVIEENGFCLEVDSGILYNSIVLSEK